jgi:superoxide dismutase, Cu-Zn family
MKKLIVVGIVVVMLAFAAVAVAGEAMVQMNIVTEQGIGKTIGTVSLADTPQGLKLTPALEGLQPGLHGFHVHDKPACGAEVKDGKPVAGLAAGGHYDPMMTGKHEGPTGKGHRGDLPALTVGKDGKATTPVVAPRLKVADVKGRSLMIHAGGDNYSDNPAALGGGGARVACGVIK